MRCRTTRTGRSRGRTTPRRQIKERSSNAGFGARRQQTQTLPDSALVRSASSAHREQLRVAIEVKRPALVAFQRAAEALPAFAVAVEVAVSEVDAGAVSVDRGEGDLDFAGVFGLGFQLPVGRDVPGQYEPMG